MTDRQMFKPVDVNTVPSEGGGCSCGRGGESKKARAEQAPEQAPTEHAGCSCGGYKAAEQAPVKHADCGYGGHDAPAEAAEAPAEQDGCGCGDYDAPVERSHEMAAEFIESTAGGCGCGDSAPSAGNVHAGGAGVIHRPGAGESVIHSIPRAMRHAVLFVAVDSLPIGESIQICAPHQPEPLFVHLQDSEQHYRVETLEVGPMDWRCCITRLVWDFLTRRGRGRLSLSRVADHGRVVCARRRSLPMPRASVRRRARAGAYFHDWPGA